MTTGNFTIFSDNNKVNGGESDSICANSSFYWNGTNYNQTGSYTYTFPGGAAGGCDSTATLNLLVFDPITGNATPQYAGDNCGVPVYDNSNDYVYGGDGNYTFNNVQSPRYCNNVGIDLPYTVYITDGHSCTGQYNGDLVLQDDVFDFVVSAQTNSSCINTSDASFSGYVVDYTNTECNPTWTLSIQGINTSYNFNTSGSAANIGSSIDFNGLLADTYHYTISGGGACAQVSEGYIYINSNNQVTGSEYDSICGNSSFFWNGNSYNQTGSYTYTFSGGAAGGCDSTATLNLWVFDPIVGAASYDTLVFGGTLHLGTQTYSQTGVYADTLSGSHGCDSVVTVHLFVRGASTYTTLYDTICQGASVTAGGHRYNANGSYIDTLSNAAGGDSVLTLHLTVIVISATSRYDTICHGSSVSLGTRSYNSNGVFTDTLIGIRGCDSIVTLHLTVIGISAVDRYDTICQGSSVSLGTHSYNSNGVFADTLSAVHGCDSIVTLHLTVYPVASVNLYDTLITGDTLHVGGHSYYQSGVYYDTLSTVHGCDSAVTVYLYAGTSSTYTHLFDTVCQGFSVTLAGHSYTVSGTYIDTLRGHLGGDSVVTLSLVVTRAILTNVYDTICQGTVYTVGSHSYSQSGVYIDTLTSRAGCDSIRALHLTVMPNATPTASITVSHGPVSGGMQTDSFTIHYTDCSNPSYTWLLNNNPLSIHSAVAVISYATGSSDSVTCQISCSNHCSTVGTATSNSIIRAGIAEISSIGDVKIYPNPTTGSFSIDINALTSGDAKITITDLLGQIVTTRSLMLRAGYNKEEFTLGENAVTGVYMVELITDGGSLFYRLVLDK